MELYLYIALVSLEGSLRRMFLCAYMLINVNDMYMLIYVLMTLCDMVSLINMWLVFIIKV